MPEAILHRDAASAVVSEAPRVRLVWSVAAYCAAIAFLTRVALILKAFAGSQLALSELPRVVLTGIAYDALTSLYLVAPLAAYLALVPSRVIAKPVHRALFRMVLTLSAFGLAYLGVVEYFFFDEFDSRFNFVAVEYLIYPHEVFVNIWQSYPVARALAACLLPAAIAWRALGPLTAALGSSEDRRRRMRVHAVFIAIVLVAAHQAVDLDTGRTHENRVADEVAANGIYAFFDAALNSRLDYDEFYVTLPPAEAAARARRFVAQDNATFIAGAQNPLARRVVYPGAAKPLNVIVLLQESLGAEFVGAYGDKRGLTPNVDRIARDSVLFTRTYATGTRTVRGMEAVTASFPPVPAESIVKRPDNERMFNWSTVMRDAGYTPTFIYGGYGAFDNMNYFFGNNGYRVIDRSDMPPPRFSNIWGVSDEDLFDHALRVFDAQHARGERIFSVVMSTSNHKPFTFPEGVDGVKAKGGGREAGVRYADYAIGRFIEALRAKPYFDDTAVVIVADHGARVYGKEDFPLRSYEIPFMVYSPAHFRPRRVNTVTSQLDVAPTVLGLLKLSYDSAFFGRDVLAGPAQDRAVPLNHNRDVALLTAGRLNELGFRKTSATIDRDTHGSHGRDDEGLKDAASVFQLAYRLYTRRQYGAR
ncbi:MAG TPA: LTA synthase family protein [Burkholderiales bacterium]|nr:LTA synthase family protein [Burkholderiales bacterium]